MTDGFLYEKLVILNNVYNLTKDRELKVIKEKKHNKCDYQKNICGYITKKIIREFSGPTFEDFA